MILTDLNSLTFIQHILDVIKARKSANLDRPVSIVWMVLKARIVQKIAQFKVVVLTHTEAFQLFNQLHHIILILLQVI